MTFLPIVERELRVASRKRGTHWMRIGGAIGALIIGGWIMMMMHSLPSQYLGKTLFITLSSVTFIFAAITGIRLTSDCLSEEKRDGTLGLLFLTDLKGYDVVFGKLAANSIGSFYGMLATFPVLAISLLLGGVTYTEFWRVAMVSVNVLFLALATGMFASSVSRDERKALSFAFVILVLLAVASPIVGWITYYENFSRFNTAYLIPSPIYGCVLAFDPVHQMKSDEFWICSLVTHAYGWLFLFLACRIVPRSWQDKAASAERLILQNKVAEITQGKSEVRKRFRTQLLEKNAFLWLAARDRMKTRLLWIFLVAVAGFWFWGLSAVKKDWLNPGIYICTALILHTAFKFWLAGEASRRFVDDRRSGALELMLSTPISVREILRGQNLALVRQFLGPVMCVLLIDVVLIFAGLNYQYIGKGVNWVIIWLAGMSVFVFDLYALAWLGMWLGMTSQKVNRAAAGGIARILFLPWLAFGVTFAVFAVLAISPAFRKLFNINLPEYFVTLYWLLLSIVNNVIWIVYAKRKLRARFREIATQRFDAPRSFWNFGRTAKPPVVAGR
ncbi:MAG: ABC transporter permease subunit [Verrucomicrobia bacterium]|nr:ABC transporter permease subunit [Verrucomicrobiota bacterium]